MPCCCQTNLQATFVLGILGLVFACLACIFGNYAGLMGLVASICFIVGAKAPNPSAILVGMIVACIECVGMIIMSIWIIVAAGAVANSAEVKSALRAQGLEAGIGALIIVGVLYTVGVVIFQIWTIMVANKARKEIDQGIKI